MNQHKNTYIMDAIQQRANNIGLALALPKDYIQKDITMAIEETTYQISTRRAQERREFINLQRILMHPLTR